VKRARSDLDQIVAYTQMVDLDAANRIAVILSVRHSARRPLA